jgi:hypothetical protein
MMKNKFNNLSSSCNSLFRPKGGSLYCIDTRLVRLVHYKKSSLFPVMKSRPIVTNPRSSIVNNKFIPNKSINKPVLVYKSPCMKNRYSSPLVLNRKFSVSAVLYTSDDELMSDASSLSKTSDNEYNSDSSDLENKLNQTLEQKTHHMKESSDTRKEFRAEHVDWSDQVRMASLNLNRVQKAEFDSLEQRQNAQIEQLKKENREFNFGKEDEECRVHYDLLKNDINIKQYQHTKERERFVEQNLGTNVLSPNDRERLEQTGENLYSIARELKTYSTKIMRDQFKHETFARGLERAESQRTSLLDDFADPSTEMSDYFSGDD